MSPLNKTHLKKNRSSIPLTETERFNAFAKAQNLRKKDPFVKKELELDSAIRKISNQFDEDEWTW